VTGAFSKAGRLIRRAAPKLTDRKINHIEFKILENRAVSIGRCNTGLKFTSGEIEGDREGQHTYGSSSGDREFIVRIYRQTGLVLSELFLRIYRQTGLVL
jgi:hypothetical protein